MPYFDELLDGLVMTDEDTAQELFRIEAELAKREGIEGNDIRRQLILRDRQNKLVEDELVADWHEAYASYLHGNLHYGEWQSDLSNLKALLRDLKDQLAGEEHYLDKVLHSYVLVNIETIHEFVAGLDKDSRYRYITGIKRSLQHTNDPEFIAHCEWVVEKYLRTPHQWESAYLAEVLQTPKAMELLKNHLDSGIKEPMARYLRQVLSR